MSGTSRIGGYGGRDAGGGGRERSASLARFCRGRRQGDVVRGVFVRRETETLGWALLEGEELLAHLPEGAAAPREGEEVFFSIASLHPDVVLRMLPGDGVAARLARAAPSLPLAQEAALYTAARDRLDALLASLPQPLVGAGTPARAPSAALPPDAPGSAPRPEPDVAARKEAFIAALAADPVCLAAFAETLLRTRALCRVGQAGGLVFFRHMPWLSRAVTGIEVSVWQTGDTPVLAGATLPSGERLLVRGALERGALRCHALIVPVGGGAARSLGDGRFRTERCRPPLDTVGRILAQAAESAASPVGRYTRQL